MCAAERSAGSGQAVSVRVELPDAPGEGRVCVRRGFKIMQVAVGDGAVVRVVVDMQQRMENAAVGDDQRRFAGAG